jgi:hypothetical protein
MTIVAEQRFTPRPTKPIDRVADFLARHSIDVLRVCLGLVFVGFAIPKFFLGLSPAEPLVTKAVDMLTLGVLHGQAAMVVTALVECFVGMTLIVGALLRRPRRPLRLQHSGPTMCRSDPPTAGGQLDERQLHHVRAHGCRTRRRGGQRHQRDRRF